MKRGTLLLILVIFIFSIPTVLAENNEVYHLKLLAVEENGETLHGSDADLFLELREGTGRIFLETFPLTKIDTQISTRFAKDIACKNFKLNCDKFDYIFTIKAKSNIIGGPSAGAAIAALTTIATLDLEYDQEIAITGTINSGGIIGHVGGVKEKVEAAKEAGLKKVLIAKGNSYMGENETDVITYAKDNLSLEVTEVNDLDDIILELTGIDLNHREFMVVEDSSYTKIMGKLQNELCQRSETIEASILEEGFILSEENNENVIMRKGRADNATLSEDFYSAASFCFGLNINLRTILLQERAWNKGKITQAFDEIENRVIILETLLAKEKIETISDLQTVMVVKERLNDVKDQVIEFRENPHTTEEYYSILAYAEERLFSAISWMQFFEMEGKKFILDEESLRNSCTQKIFEAEERNQYAILFIEHSRADEVISQARTALEEGEYELCLITASQAKSQSNAILSSIGLRDEIIDEFIESKRRVTERVIAENSAEDVFPILGYSYYQYANSLQFTEKFSTLLYLEYALEMSEISIYFPEEKTFLENTDLELDEKWLYLIIGFIIGIATTIVFLSRKRI
jgi:uncharacterized protein